jgi:tRNA(Ile)-lysidine synthase
VVSKVEKKKILIKDPKIKKIYTKFKAIIFKKIKKRSFAVAVSGGSDSLCLAYLSKMHAYEFKNKIHILIVDHQLRKESHKEALKVKGILKKKGIKSTVLNWKGRIPKSNIQRNARHIRYSLISNYCSKKNIKFLITAHHTDDQIENFFIRLFRGSGLAGLSSMSESVNYNRNLKIVRPFLSFKKKDLKYITLNFFKTYIKDPSNENEKFLRVRIRKYRRNMENEGLGTGKIIKTVNNLLSASKALNFYKDKALHKYVSFLPKNKCSINTQIFSDEAGEIIFRSFSDILSLVSGTYYPPRSKKIISLINRVKKTTFNKSTLGGCVIEKKDNLILISKEQRTKNKKNTFSARKMTFF